MAVQDFVVKLSLDTSGFGRSMTSINRDMKLLKSEFSASDEKLKAFGSNIERLKNKQDYLSKSLTLQKEKVESLKEAYDKQVKATGENSKEAQNLGVRLNNQIKYYNKLEHELKETTEALNKAEKEIKQQQSAFAKLDKSLKKTGDNLQKLSGKLKDIGGAMSAKLTAPIIGGFTALTAGTKELRENMAFLETNTQRAGYQFNDIKGKVKDVNAIFGDMDSSVEGVSDLMKTGLNSEQFTQALNFCTDAAITFKDTLKFEGVADGLQETLATGQATGPFAEALDRAGISTEKLNEDLKNCSSETERTNMIMNAMAKSGLAGATEEFKKMHPEIVAQNRAMEDLKMTAAEIGQKLVPMMQPLLDTTVTLLDKIDAFATAHPDLFNNIVKGLAGLAVVGPIISGASKAVSGLAKVFTAFTATGAIGKLFAEGGLFAAGGTMATAFSGLGTKIGAALTSKLGLIGLVISGFILLYNHCDLFRATFDEVWGWVTSHLEGFPEWFNGLLTEADEWIQLHLGGLPQWFRDKWSEMKTDLADMGNNWNTFWSGVWGSTKRIFSNVGTWFGEKFTEAKNAVVSAWSSVSGWFSGIWESIKGVFSSVGTWFGEKFGEAKNLIVSNFNALVEQLKGVWESIKGIFSNVGSWFGEKFGEAKNLVVGNFNALVGQVKGIWDKIKSIVSNAIDSIKGFLDFDWSLPPIKTPHFTKTGETVLGLPKIGVEWYKNGGIMTKPTMFGLNGNNPMVGGEAGAEAILPLRVLFKQMRDIIRDEVGTQPINVVVNVNNEMDGKQIGKVVTYEVKKNIDRSTRNYNKNKGK